MAQIYYQINSGYPNFTAHIEPNVAPDQIHSSTGIYSFNDIPAGNYSITVTDAIGCEAFFDNIVITTTTTSTTTSTTSSTTTTTTTEAPLLSMVMFADASSPAKIYSYYPLTQSSIERFTANSTYTDICHTDTKLWLTSFSTAREYNITLDPWTESYNRDINNLKSSPAACAINNSTIVNAYTNDASIWENNITGANAVLTSKFSTLPNRRPSGDVMVTTTGKLLLTTYDTVLASTGYITQYDYATGNMEVDKSFSTAGNQAPYGLFQYLGEIYITMYTGDIFHVQKTSPWTLTFINNVGYNINGASQVPEYLTGSLIP